MSKKISLLAAFKITALISLIIGVQANASANNFYVATHGIQQGVTLHTFKLQALTSFSTPFPVTALAVGLNNDVYLVSGNRIYNYTADGVLIKSLGSKSTVNYTGISVMGDRVYASYSGYNRGVNVRDLALNSVSSFSTSFIINAIAAGANNELYLASGNSLYRYQSNGTLLASITFSDKGLYYNHVAIMCGKLLSSYSGSQRGVSIRDLTTLAQSSSFSTAFEITGLISGQNNDVYLSANNYLFNYTLTGIQKQNATASQLALLYGDLAR
jgi:hypothetical protein